MASESIFLRRKQRLFRFPLVALEYFGNRVTPEMSEDDRATAIIDTLQQFCGVTGAITTLILSEFIDRLNGLNKKDQGNTASSKKRKNTFRSSYDDWLGDLPTDSLLAEMTGYDFAKMNTIYCELDFEDAKQMIDTYIRGKSEEHRVLFEASLYGSGNSYKGDKVTSDANVIKWDADSKAGMAAMSQFGFGSVGGLEQFGIDLSNI